MNRHADIHEEVAERYFFRLELSRYSGPGPDVRGRDGFLRFAPWPYWIVTDFRPIRRSYEYPHDVWEWETEAERDRFTETIRLLGKADWGIVQADSWCFGVLDEAVAYLVAVAMDFEVRPNPGHP